LVKSGKDLTADLIIAGRNRSDLSLSDPFLEAVKPRAIIASHAAFPVAEQLPSEAVNYWKSRGIQVVHQGESGGVTVRVDDAGELVLEGYVDRSLVTLKPR
jgi:beta-lactamase superfamily II metal-dependent hydrolase